MPRQHADGDDRSTPGAQAKERGDAAVRDAAGSAERPDGAVASRRTLPPPPPDDVRALVTAMRRGDPGAFTHFVERYHRVLLHYARRAAFRGADADAIVQTVLGDAAVALLAPGARVSDDLALDLVRRFRHRFRHARRAEDRRERRLAAAAEEIDGGADGERAALCSDDQRRASRAPDWEPAAGEATSALEALAWILSESLTEDERRMLAWDSEDVPQREIAARLGISHAAARQRLKRLRDRLRATAVRYAAGLEGDGARAVRRFLRRTLAAAEKDAATVECRAPRGSSAAGTDVRRVAECGPRPTPGEKAYGRRERAAEPGGTTDE